MELKKGYKQTDLGVIPDDWGIKEFADVMDGFSSGQTPYRAVVEYYKGDIPWITSGELNYNIIIDTIEKITIEGAREANLKKIPKGTFLFAITGLEAAGTRGSCAITGIEATTNQSCMALYPKKGLLTTPYLYHYYVRYGNELAFKYCQGTKQQSYTGGIAKKLPIIVPPSLSEQTAIANALSDMDALINQTEKLIEKKKAIKQGAMQELLKPKEGWVTKKLGELAVIYTGKKNNQDKIFDGKYPFFVRSQTIERINSYSFDGEAILIPGEGNIGKIFHYINGKFDFHQRVYKISDFKDGITGKYIYRYMTEYFGRHALENSVKATVDSLRLPTIQAFNIPFPLEIKEQERITNILNDIDNNIAIIQNKLNKLKQQKQGMMQALLTGKIRLV
jgi:type I restriction enzyme S subunit